MNKFNKLPIFTKAHVRFASFTNKEFSTCVGCGLEKYRDIVSVTSYWLDCNMQSPEAYLFRALNSLLVAWALEGKIPSITICSIKCLNALVKRYKSEILISLIEEEAYRVYKS